MHALFLFEQVFVPAGGSLVTFLTRYRTVRHCAAQLLDVIPDDLTDVTAIQCSVILATSLTTMIDALFREHARYILETDLSPAMTQILSQMGDLTEYHGLQEYVKTIVPLNALVSQTVPHGSIGLSSVLWRYSDDTANCRFHVF